MTVNGGVNAMVTRMKNDDAARSKVPSTRSFEMPKYIPPASRGVGDGMEVLQWMHVLRTQGRACIV